MNFSAKFFLFLILGLTFFDPHKNAARAASSCYVSANFPTINTVALTCTSDGTTGSGLANSNANYCAKVVYSSLNTQLIQYGCINGGSAYQLTTQSPLITQGSPITTFSTTNSTKSVYLCIDNFCNSGLSIWPSNYFMLWLSFILTGFILSK